MWTCNAEGVFESGLLNQFPWLWHGFGSRTSDGWPGSYTSLKQIHSNHVQIATGDGCLGEGDALVTGTPGVPVGIRTADCVPILLVEPDKRVVAAVHAGWRGTVARVVQKTAAQMVESFAASPGRLHAAIGPCIAECCFEVGLEVASEFSPWLAGTGTRRRIDLVAVNVAQLLEAGVPSEQIDLSGLCTVCDPQHFHSYRRDREQSGRMVAAIGLTEG